MFFKAWLLIMGIFLFVYVFATEPIVFLVGAFVAAIFAAVTCTIGKESKEESIQSGETQHNSG